MVGDYDAILIVINDKDDMSKAKAVEVAGQVKLIGDKYPESMMSLHLEGYDEDKREIWEIPEAIIYIGWFAEEMHRLGLPPNFAKRLDESSLRWAALDD